MTTQTEKRGTLLCVQDDDDTCNILADLVPEYQVHIARTGFDALRALNSRAFDAYVLDYWLPDWSGPALCRQIRKLDPHVPIVFYSAAAREQDQRRGLRAGANAYFTKPADPVLLRSRLRVLMRLTDLESTSARIAVALAVQEELARRLRHVSAQMAASDESIAASIERTARAKGLRAYIDGRGTQAAFDKGWPQLFASALASARVLRCEGTRAAESDTAAQAEKTTHT